LLLLLCISFNYEFQTSTVLSVYVKTKHFFLFYSSRFVSHSLVFFLSCYFAELFLLDGLVAAMKGQSFYKRSEGTRKAAANSKFVTGLREPGWAALYLGIWVIVAAVGLGVLGIFVKVTCEGVRPDLAPLTVLESLCTSESLDDLSDLCVLDTLTDLASLCTASTSPPAVCTGLDVSDLTTLCDVGHLTSLSTFCSSNSVRNELVLLTTNLTIVADSLSLRPPTVTQTIPPGLGACLLIVPGIMIVVTMLIMWRNYVPVLFQERDADAPKKFSFVSFLCMYTSLIVSWSVVFALFWALDPKVSKDLQCVSGIGEAWLRLITVSINTGFGAAVSSAPGQQLHLVITQTVMKYIFYVINILILAAATNVVRARTITENGENVDARIGTSLSYDHAEYPHANVDRRNVLQRYGGVQPYDSIIASSPPPPGKEKLDFHL